MERECEREMERECERERKGAEHEEEGENAASAEPFRKEARYGRVDARGGGLAKSTFGGSGTGVFNLDDDEVRGTREKDRAVPGAARSCGRHTRARAVRASACQRGRASLSEVTSAAAYHCQRHRASACAVPAVASSSVALYRARQRLQHRRSSTATLEYAGSVRQLHGLVIACAHACVRASVRACVRAGVRACVRVGVSVGVRVDVG
eukprot:6191057-Pleurochrysis_carterae.AAC.1